MGIYDRDYYRNTPPRGGFGYFHMWSITTWLIIINVVVFFLDGMLHRMAPPVAMSWDYEPTFQDFMGPLERWGYFSTATAVFGGQLWRFVTFQFLHASPGHLFANMLGLYFFGPIVEAHFGPRRYLAFYLLCGLAGAGSYVFLAASHILGTGAESPLVGASAGIFGLLVSAAMIAPDVTIYIIFLPISIRMLAILSMVLAAYTVFALGSVGSNAGGEAAHLGGGALGFLLMRNQHWLSVFAPRGRASLSGPGRRRPPRPSQKDWSKDFNR
jgi:membrane associated rhomboid family serine protease